MSVTVHTDSPSRTYPDADDFTVNLDSGTLTVKRTDDDGELVAIFAVYAPGAWRYVTNDDADLASQ